MRSTKQRLTAIASALALGLLPAALATAQPAAAAAPVGKCPGKLLETWSFVDKQKIKIAEMKAYYDSKTGRNCAVLNHVGPTVGVALETHVYVMKCYETEPYWDDCHETSPVVMDSDPQPAKYDTKYKYYAGPVSVPARGHCVEVAGWIVYKGENYYERTNPASSFCD
jgi:hypothetical protein